MYSLGDLAVIIPTYNRAEDLKETLRALLPRAKDLCQIIIVDQSTHDETKKMVRSLQKKQGNLKYLFSKIPAITIARNLGVKHTSKQAKLVCFIDDDVTLGENYFEEILHIFNEYPEAKGAAGYVPSPELAAMPSIERALRMFFRIGYGEINRARILSTYGNTYPSTLTRTIHAHWLPGVNMVYKREVFREQQFDEHLRGYTVAEDIDFTCRLYRKHPRGMFITPFAHLVHRVSPIGRYPTAKMGYINQVDHFYFYLKNLRKETKQWFLLAWSLLGITLLRSLKSLASRKREDVLKFKFFLSSLVYCFWNKEKIQSGKIREFLQNRIT